MSFYLTLYLAGTYYNRCYLGKMNVFCINILYKASPEPIQRGEGTRKVTAET